MNGHLIILEGPDAAGKTTTARSLADRLTASGHRVRRFALPGDEPGTLGKLVYGIHHDPARHGVNQVHPTSMQVLHAAAHIDAIHTRIRPALDRGETVIMDRFWWSTIVYGRLAGVDERTLDLLRQLADHHWRAIVPTGAFVLLGCGAGAHGAHAMRLQNEYVSFAESLAPTFPVVLLRGQAGVFDYAERILNTLEPLCRSSAT